MTLDIADRAGAFLVLVSSSCMGVDGSSVVSGLAEAGAGLGLRPGRKSECVLVSAGRVGLLGAMERGAVFDVRMREEGEVVMAWAGGWRLPLDKRRTASYVDGVAMDGPCWGGRGEWPGFGVGVSCLGGSQFGRSMVVGRLGVMGVLGEGLGCGELLLIREGMDVEMM